MTDQITVGPLNRESELPNSIFELVKLINGVKWEELTEEDKQDFPLVQDADARICRLGRYRVVVDGNMAAFVAEGGLEVVYELAINQVDFY